MKHTEMVPMNGILYRIKEFFRHVFGGKQNKEVELETETKNNISIKEKFKDNIVIEKDREQERLLDLQQSYRNGEIEEKDINPEDIEKLNQLYDEQIEKVEKKILENVSLTEKYKKEILEMKKKQES